VCPRPGAYKTSGCLWSSDGSTKVTQGECVCAECLSRNEKKAVRGCARLGVYKTSSACGALTDLQRVTQGDHVPAECLSRNVIMYRLKYVHRGTLPE